MKKRQVGVIGCLLLTLTQQSFAVDPLYEKFIVLINESILPWTRLLGVIGLIATVLGLLKARHDQSDTMKVWVNSIAFFFGILLLPEIINWAIGSATSAKIDLN